VTLETRCPCWTEDPERTGVCFYCDKPKASHDAKAVDGPYPDPNPHGTSPAVAVFSDDERNDGEPSLVEWVQRGYGG
jgi:hypothetical protein